MSDSSIARSSAVMAAGTFASRILGLVRNALLLTALGATASGAADAFSTANNLPTQLYNLIIGGVLNAILVPQIVTALRKRNGEELVNRLLTTASAAIAVVAALMTVAAPAVIMLYASGLGRWQPLAFSFAFWCMPQIFFYGLYALWGQVLNARSSFGPYMWSPVINNIISIGSLIIFLRVYGHYTAGQDPGIWDAGRIAMVGATTTLGIAVQAMVLYIPLVRSGFHPRLVWGMRGLGLGAMSKVALWALLGTAIVSLGDIATTQLASRAVTAAESAQYANVIVPSKTIYDNTQLVYMLPQSLVTTSIITALFTRMSSKAAAGDRDGVRDDLSLGLRTVAVFTVLFAAGIATLAAPALQLFAPSLSWAEADASSPILVVLAIGIIFQGIWFTAQRVMLAYSDTKRLLIADAVVGVVPVILCLGSYLLLPANYWMVGAAAGSLLSQVGGSAAVIPLIRRHLPQLDSRRVVSTYIRLIVAAMPAVVVGLAVRSILGPSDGTLTGTRAFDALITVLVAALLMTSVYLLTARLLEVGELAVLFSPLSKLVVRIGSFLPGGLGDVVTRVGQSFAIPTTTRMPAARHASTLVRFGDSTAPAQATARRTTWRGTRPGVRPAARPAQPAAQPVVRRAGRHAAPPVVPPVVQPVPVTMARTEELPPVVLSAPPTAVPPPIPAPAPPPGPGPVPAPPAEPVATIGAHPYARTRRRGGRRMTEGTPIGTGRYRLLSTLPATLPRIVRHLGYDTILDRDVTILALTAATPHRDEVLETATRAVLVEDERMQRVHDVETSSDAFIVTEPTEGVPFSTFARADSDPALIRAIIGEVAQVLDACSRRGLHHLHLSPDSVRLRPDGRVQLSGVGIEAAVLGLQGNDSDPLAFDRTDARALIELLYYGLTGRWPGKRSGIASAPMVDGAPAPPSSINHSMGADDADLDALVARTWGSNVPISASEVARALEPWDTSVLVEDAAIASEADFEAETTKGGRGVLSRLRGLSSARPVQRAAQEAAAIAGEAASAEGLANTATVSFPAAPSNAMPPAFPPPLPSSPSPDEDEEDYDEGESSSSSRTATVIIVVTIIVLLVGLLFAVQNLVHLFQHPISDEDKPAAETVPSNSAGANPGPQQPAQPAQPAAPITISGAQSLDPFGDNNEHPELAGNLVDGDPGTEWYSRFYNSSTMDSKKGIGVAVTLASPARVSAIELQGTGSGGHVQIRATSPEDPQGGTLLAEGAFTQGTTTFEFTPTETGSIVVWVTEMPRASDGLNKATISEITLR
ncbi:murein biosynthesis integral membrane protein MurJ [uncultured Actinomyces sp.]|uniref:murein biosynthesis integral membrane protein MurJ n=1 Tax=uncultured Actinomyces sp. TaxID=249061 RepID=UPI00288ADAC7|nr:murein biosynthesis integral membrane protein MurJ [uncultured Actinomyces sp.]